MTSLIEQVRQSKTALTVPKLATMLSMSKRAIYDHVDRGSLPAIRIGTAVRLDPKTTAEWLEARCTAA